MKSNFRMRFDERNIRFESKKKIGCNADFFIW